MLSLNRCREILGADERLSDQEVEHVRGQSDAFAEVAVSVALTGDRPAVETLDSRWTAAQAHLTEDERVEVEERAAIFEVDERVGPTVCKGCGFGSDTPVPESSAGCSGHLPVGSLAGFL